MATFTPALHKSITEIGKDVWDGFADGNPFSCYDYLNALEQTNCLGASNGWQVNHLSIKDENGIIQGVMPFYLKYHSQGEYVFDHAWAEAYERAGGNYYPKLLCASPFTPVTGARIFAKNDECRHALLQAAKMICDNNQLSAFSVNFPNPDELPLFESENMLLRQDIQYWWENRDYNNFDDFLSGLSSSRRKSIKRERREVLAKIDIKIVEGDEISESHLDDLYRFICDTYARKWGQGVPYLTREFFSHILSNMRYSIVIFFAFSNGKAIAGAINFKGDDVIYGRQWGCVEDVPFLHFELCYYQAIEYAIKHKIKWVEAGTQGQHKFARGYMPHKVYSAHYLREPNFAKAVEDFLKQECEIIDENIKHLLATASPYKSSE